MRRILLVEDNQLSQLMMYHTLKARGIEAEMASDGQEAVEKNSANPYDLILMDIQMPKLNGYEATQAIRVKELTTGKHSYIIGLTGNVYDNERARCQAAGMDDYLTKPFDYAQLEEVLKTLDITL